MRRLLLLLVVLVAPVALRAETPSDYVRSVEAFRAKRDANLRKPDGWLTLAGLFWLREGASTFGSAPGCDLRFPQGAPARIGVLRRQARSVKLEVDPAVEVRVDGKPVRHLALDPGAPEGTTKMTLGRWTWYLVQRGDRLGIRLKDSQSPVLLGFKGTEWYPVAPAWRVEARFERHDPPRPLKVPNVLGASTAETSPGAAVFRVGGREFRLDLLGEAKDAEYFLVFSDATNGHGTYDAGRFLDVPRPDAKGRVVLDFNRAYSPPCAFTPYATCPIPPPANRLDLAIPAGEKYRGHH